MQNKKIKIESKIQNMSRLFSAVGNQEFVVYLTFFISMNFTCNHFIDDF